jgi:stringent starvation protein B
MRALYEWCVDSGLTPYISVRVDEFTRVPKQFIKDGQIVLNVGPGAVRDLHMDNEWVSFSARFGGVAHDILVPVGNVLAIYARETGDGMAFPQTESGEAPAMLELEESAQDQQPTTEQQEGKPPQPERPKGPPSLRVVK